MYFNETDWYNLSLKLMFWALSGAEIKRTELRECLELSSSKRLQLAEVLRG